MPKPPKTALKKAAPKKAALEKTAPKKSAPQKLTPKAAHGKAVQDVFKALSK